jgi:death-on-curing protein
LLPDGNKRASWAALLLFVDLKQAMMAVAVGEVDEDWVADWLRERVRFYQIV